MFRSLEGFDDMPNFHQFYSRNFLRKQVESWLLGILIDRDHPFQ